MKLEKLILVASVVTLLTLWVVLARAETVCISTLVPGQTQAEREPLQRQVEGWVRERGYAVDDCDGAEWELVVQPMAGTGKTGATYFVAEWAAGDSSVVGLVTARPETYRYRAWMVALFPVGGEWSVYRQNGVGLKGNVRRALKRVGKQGLERDW